MRVNCRQYTLRLWMLASLPLASCTAQNALPSLNQAIESHVSSWFSGTTILNHRPGASEIGISVFPFTDFGERRTGLCGLGTDLVIESLSKSGKARVHDASTMDEILDAQDLSASGRTAPGTGVKIGKIKHSDLLMFGKIGVVDGTGLLMLTLINPETGEVAAKNSVKFLATPGLQSLDRRNISGQFEAGESSENLAMSFLVSNWPWLWTVILVPAALWLAKRSLSRRSKSGMSQGRE